jgi:hypothetical protein
MIPPALNRASLSGSQSAFSLASAPPVLATVLWLKKAMQPSLSDRTLGGVIAVAGVLL